MPIDQDGEEYISIALIGDVTKSTPLAPLQIQLQQALQALHQVTAERDAMKAELEFLRNLKQSFLY